LGNNKYALISGIDSELAIVLWTFGLNWMNNIISLAI